MNKQKSEPTIKVIARAPFELYFEGDARALSAKNKVGPFDILPGHADFFSVLSPGEVIIDPAEGESIRFNLESGIVTAQDDEVLLFVNV